MVSDSRNESGGALRVEKVTHHITKLEGVNQLIKIWLEESLRACRIEHDLEKREMSGMGGPDDDGAYLITTSHLETLELYRETLERLSQSVEKSNPKKAEVYRGLREATDLDGVSDTYEGGMILL